MIRFFCASCRRSSSFTASLLDLNLERVILSMDRKIEASRGISDFMRALRNLRSWLRERSGNYEGGISGGSESGIKDMKSMGLGQGAGTGLGAG